MNDSDTKREMLRHTIATLAYRGAKAVRGADDSFASFRASETTRTPVQILAHIGDLLDWALSAFRANGILNRFDGLRFKRFPLNTIESGTRPHINSICSDAAGRLCRPGGL